jgi:hypothetical protein
MADASLSVFSLRTPEELGSWLGRIELSHAIISSAI